MLSQVVSPSKKQKGPSSESDLGLSTTNEKSVVTLSFLEVKE